MVLQDILTLVKQVSFLSGVEDDVLLDLARRASVRTYPAHTIILHEGDESGFLYVILEGRARVFVGDADGREITLTHLEPGAYFGELALLDDKPRSASVLTLEKTVCGAVSKTVFKQWLTDHPQAAFGLIHGLTNKIRELTEQVRVLALSNVYGRIAKLLNDMAVEDNGRRVIPERLTQQELANRIGASREMVSKILTELKKGEYIQTEDHQLVILKPLPASW